MLTLRLLKIDVPAHALVTTEAELKCDFDMEGDMLYSVKWYKDDLEFYRYVPNDTPKLQIFPQRGVKVSVSPAIRAPQKLPRILIEESSKF